jgi:hypothetical protein
MTTSRPAPPFPLGARVLVRCRFDGHWASGFAVSALTVADDRPAVLVRRLSDGSELPHVFDPHDVRPADD